ncbi:hypothetical protein AKA01nite_03990 [Alkalibacterium kapii]|uniref:HTH cro/C1-type domain-containing protein n=2 Tax=Alkalibacterium kapii TaxID=426704 RepID=A0A511AYT9_9LACT|nr:hypothetical protein AKA01nite_03990 [Alkalibacterium kapii]
MKIGQKLKEKRQQANLTQKQLADILHVSRQTISSWEVGRTYPDLDVLVAISELYSIPLDDLLKDDSTMVEDITKKVKKSERRKMLNIVLVFVLTLVSSFSLFFILKERQKTHTNDLGLSPSDLYYSTWEMNYDPTHEVNQSIISFDRNNVATYYRYGSAGSLTTSNNEVNNYNNLRIEVDNDKYIVTAHGYSQEYTRLSDTIIKDSNGLEYYKALSETSHDSLFWIADQFEDE